MTLQEEKNHIVQRLQSHNVEVESVYDLVNSKAPYPQAIPVLIGLLEEGVNHLTQKEGIIRALGVKEAKGPAGPLLIKEFWSLPEEMEILRWVVGNSLRFCSTKDDVSEIIKIVQSKEFGSSRGSFVTALSNYKTEEVENILIEGLQDEDIRVECIEGLGKLKSKKAKEYVAAFENDGKDLVRKEAKKALNKIK